MHPQGGAGHAVVQTEENNTDHGSTKTSSMDGWTMGRKDRSVRLQCSMCVSSSVSGSSSQMETPSLGSLGKPLSVQASSQLLVQAFSRHLPEHCRSMLGILVRMHSFMHSQMQFCPASARGAAASARASATTASAAAAAAAARAMPRTVVVAPDDDVRTARARCRPLCRVRSGRARSGQVSAGVVGFQGADVMCPREVSPIPSPARAVQLAIVASSVGLESRHRLVNHGSKRLLIIALGSGKTKTMMDSSAYGRPRAITAAILAMLGEYQLRSGVDSLFRSYQGRVWLGGVKVFMKFFRSFDH